MDVSQLEQDLACNDDHSNQVVQLVPLLFSSESSNIPRLHCHSKRKLKELREKIQAHHIKSADKLRLAILYALRYESSGNIMDVKRQLLSCGMREDQVALLDAVLQAAGKVRRRPEQ